MAMSAAGCEVKRGKYLAYKIPGSERFIRVKSLGEDYTKQALRERCISKRQKPSGQTAKVLDYGSAASDEYGRICSYLRREGTPIDQMDMLIAAQAKAEGLIVVTNNTREFERVGVLRLEDWTC